MRGSPPTVTSFTAAWPASARGHEQQLAALDRERGRAAGRPPGRGRRRARPRGRRPPRRGRAGAPRRRRRRRAGSPQHEAGAERVARVEREAVLARAVGHALDLGEHALGRAARPPGRGRWCRRSPSWRSTSPSASAPSAASSAQRAEVPEPHGRAVDLAVGEDRDVALVQVARAPRGGSSRRSPTAARRGGGAPRRCPSSARLTARPASMSRGRSSASTRRPKAAAGTEA